MRVLILDSLPIVRPLFFLSFMLVTDNLCRLALWRIARFVCSFDVVSAPSLFHPLRFLFVVWLSTELVDVLTGESLPWHWNADFSPSLSSRTDFPHPVTSPKRKVPRTSHFSCPYKMGVPEQHSSSVNFTLIIKLKSHMFF
ncbi:hypothetical protein EDB83DRAFT_116717 [Lactarius deliciosus]|nr:hypothetical protein EDB83DRAFT_116717 [Lactarius deliciosus]